MKKTSVAFCLVPLMGSSLFGASISVSNRNFDGTDVHIRSSSGATTFSSGVFAFYQLNQAPADALAVQQLGVSGRLGSEFVLNSGNLGPADTLGPSGAFTVRDIDLGNFTAATANLDLTDFYWAIGNGSSLATSTEVALLQLDIVAQPEIGTLEAIYNYSPFDLTDVVIGTPGTGTADYTADNGPADFAVNTLSLVQAVPEPSTAALLGLGALGLIRRRR